MINRSTPNSIYWHSQRERNRKLLEIYQKHKMEPAIHNGRLLEPYVYSMFDHEYLGHIDSEIDHFEIWLNENEDVYKHLVEVGDLK